MAGLVPAIHVFSVRKDVGARNKCGHDERVSSPPLLREPDAAEHQG
jgi:hypothetical protein